MRTFALSALLGLLRASALRPVPPKAALRGASVSRRRASATIPRRRLAPLGGAAAAALLGAPRGAGALGVVDGLLEPCPETASCSSSQDDAARGGRSFAPPWAYDDATWEGARERLLDALGADAGVSDVAVDGRYVRCAGDGADDVEFYFTESDATVQFRAARRGGGTDRNANRDRLERLRRKCGFEQLVILRNRRRLLGVVESPFDDFGPSFFNVGDEALLTDPDVLRTRDPDPLAPSAFPPPDAGTRRWLREKRRDG